jgi:fructokinase
MMPRHGALVIGEALVDIVRTGNDVIHCPGGSCANVAVALARLGRPTLLATRYGDDRLGDLLEKHLAGSGVVIHHGSRRRGARTSTADADIEPDGSATYRFDLTWDVTLDDLEPAAHAVVRVGSIGAQLLPGADSVAAAVEALRETAIVSYDLNARPALFGEPSAARERVARLIAASDIAKASDEDLAWLYPHLSVEETAAAWLDLGAAAVLVTRAGKGATVFTLRDRVDVAGAPVKVVDTIGAGDTFSAAAIDGLWSSGLVGAGNRDRLRDLASPQWRRIAEYAALAASMVVSRPGADPPHAHEMPPKPSIETVPHDA